MIRKIGISAVFALAIIISLIVERSVVTKHYFTMVFASLFFLYWCIEFVLEYVEFRKAYQKKYKYYKAKLINENNLSKELIEKENKKYYKRFKGSMLKESLLKLGVIAGLFGGFLAIFIAIFI